MTPNYESQRRAMFTFLLIIQTLVALSLITVILMQRSEGGGLTGGGSPAGLMTARGAADFLTRATTILASAFIVLSLVLAALAAHTGSSRTIDPNLVRQQQQQKGLVPAAPATQPLPNAGPAGAPALSAPIPAAPANNQNLPAAH
jgi:preprotein translocase subunit SecG